jgi:tRNA(fMet)-specific endonuclease VapC
MRREGGVVPGPQSLPPQRPALPSVVVLEVRFGLLRKRMPAALAAFEELTAACGRLDFDAEAADHAARIRLQLESAGKPIGLADLLIAATARRHGCTLVTHNTREFSRVPDLLLDDWY